MANPTAWIDPLGLAGGKGKQWDKDGGNWYDMRPSNPPNVTPRGPGSFEINHMPAKNSWEQLNLANTMNSNYGPSIRMEYDDHRKFISTGSGPDSIAWRAKQAKLISQGKFDVAMKMDIGKIRKQFGTKYDAAIAEMVADLPNNTRLQSFLSKNGWKIRTCLLK